MRGRHGFDNNFQRQLLQVTLTVLLTFVATKTYYVNQGVGINDSSFRHIIVSANNYTATANEQRYVYEYPEKIYGHVHMAKTGIKSRLFKRGQLKENAVIIFFHTPKTGGTSRSVVWQRMEKTIAILVCSLLPKHGREVAGGISGCATAIVAGQSRHEAGYE